MTRKLSSVHRVGIFAIVFVLILAVALLLWGRSRPDDVPVTDERTVTTAPVPEASQSQGPVVAVEDPPELVATKEAIDRRLEDFVATYYSRTPRMYVGGDGAVQERFVRRVSPYFAQGVAAESAVPDLQGDSLAAMVRDGRSFVAMIDQMSVVGHIGDDGSSVEQTMDVVLVDMSTKEVVRTVEVVIRLEASGQTWLVVYLMDSQVMP